jgi:alginate O-acetyltransferase complex protein AlgI
MAFSSNFFIFAFLPAVLAAHYAAPRAWRNAVLTCASLLFYAFDSGYMAWLLVVSVLLNHYAAYAITALAGRERRWFFFAGVGANLALLAYYKYGGFAWQSMVDALGWLGIGLAPAAAIPLPIGISFFTFQAISYLSDVYTRHAMPARRLVDFAMYHSLFPQLIAGPIVRYVEIEEAIYKRSWALDRAADGGYRFCIGLGKKLILADTMGRLADSIFALPANERTAVIAWLGLFAYTLQIYFDFSGYSDMAIGLGKLLGFDFPENFNLPYRSRSITEFWRRWHMTLSRWFRDYVYVPLGGNREGSWRTYRNLFTVFLLCGLWHGAGWPFVAWGLWHGGWLVIERAYREHRGPLPTGPAMWAGTLLLVMLGWVLFRSPTLGDALDYYAALFGVSQPVAVYYGLTSFLTPYNAAFMVVATFFAIGPLDRLALGLGEDPAGTRIKSAAALTVLLYAVLMLSANSFNPFIYFRF